MRTRRIGDDPVGVVGLGCMGMSFAFSPDPGSERPEEVIAHALALGCNLLDTADIYGDNEEVLGAALAGRRQDAFIATKCGLHIEQESPFLITRPRGDAAHIRESTERSLRRLRTDVLDLLQLHRVDPDIPVEETWGTMAGLVEEGKVRYLGISNATADEVARAHRVHPVAACQSELSLWSQEPLDDLLPWCAQHGATFIAFSPLGRGFLTGTIGPDHGAFPPDDLRASLARFSEDAIERNQALVAVVADVAARLGTTTGQVALAWVLAQGPHVVAIPGTRRRARVTENVAAADIELTAQDLAELSAAPMPVEPRVRWEAPRLDQTVD